jgi:hypothetical protein
MNAANLVPTMHKCSYFVKNQVVIIYDAFLRAPARLTHSVCLRRFFGRGGTYCRRASHVIKRQVANAAENQIR